MAEPSVTCLTRRNSCFAQQLALSLSLCSGFPPFHQDQQDLYSPRNGEQTLLSSGANQDLQLTAPKSPSFSERLFSSTWGRAGGSSFPPPAAGSPGQNRGMHKQARETRGPRAGKDVLRARASQHYGFGMKIAVYSTTGRLGTIEGFSKKPLLCPKGRWLLATRGPPPSYTSSAEERPSTPRREHTPSGSGVFL